MKNGVLVCFGWAKSKNIGDYVQSLAARQFAGRTAVCVEREELDRYAGEAVRLVMNGWFMFRPERFPPAAGISPLFASVHVRPSIEKSFFTAATVAYLKKYEPIGCRSTETVEMMRRHGIRAEFTSCLTLTLGATYRHVRSDSPPVFVDPYLPPLRKSSRIFFTLRQMLARLPFAVRHLPMLLRLSRKFKTCCCHLPGSRFAPVRWYYLTEFYRRYSPAFSDELLLSADYLSHGVTRTRDSTDETFMAKADELLRRYEKTPYVVTSRLHCALPCLAMGTPVWLPYAPEMANGRFGGNLDFLTCLTFGPDGRCRPPAGGKITSATRPPPVRTEFRPYAEALARRCREFFRPVALA